MSIITTIIETVLTRIIASVKREDLEKMKMKLYRKIKVSELSMSACELIVATLENSGAIIKTESGLCVSVNQRLEPFLSGIPEPERKNDFDALNELCDRGLMDAYAGKLYCASAHAKKNVGTLKRLDDLRVFVYAPETVKTFYPIMATQPTIISIPFWSDKEARMIARGSLGGFHAKLVSRQECEEAILYMYREGLLDGVWFADDMGEPLLGLNLNAGFDLQAIASFFGDSLPLRIIADVSKRGRRIAQIDVGNLGEYVKAED